MSKIVLIEDEVLVLEATKELLKTFGHDVRAVFSGGDAFRVLAEEKGEVDLVILDLSLPDIDGRQLLLQLVRDYPQIRIIICSGSQLDEQEFSSIPNVKALLGKPYGMSELKAVVCQALESGQ